MSCASGCKAVTKWVRVRNATARQDEGIADTMRPVVVVHHILFPRLAASRYRCCDSFQPIKRTSSSSTEAT